MYPYNIIGWIKRVLVAATISVCIGAIFWSIRRGKQEQEILNDRVGFHYSVMGLALWPLVLHTVTQIWSEKSAVTRDVKDKLYSKLLYILTMVSYK